MLDGEQYVFKGGSATVVDMSGGTQIVRVSGNGMIETLNGGEQNIMGRHRSGQYNEQWQSGYK